MKDFSSKFTARESVIIFSNGCLAKSAIFHLKSKVTDFVQSWDFFIGLQKKTNTDLVWNKIFVQ